MARYKALGRAFINDVLVEAGTEIEFDGEPGDNLEPVDDAAHDAVEVARKRRSEKAAALATGVGGIVTEEMQKLLSSVSDGLSALRGEFISIASRVAALESAPAGASVDTSAFAAKSDVDELDAGLQIFGGRLDEIEGVLAALSKKAEAPASPTPAPVEEPTPVADEPAAAPEEAPAAPVSE
ncbi:MAG: hypothetical protein E6R03_12195 [Hyphomicrobiaceae bacterium]|nr:MAG: hypothetical protein E6R03_12195 [Hyphomicrobiaceae bacterium]